MGLLLLDEVWCAHDAMHSRQLASQGLGLVTLQTHSHTVYSDGKCLLAAVRRALLLPPSLSVASTHIADANQEKPHPTVDLNYMRQAQCINFVVDSMSTS